MLSDLAAVCRPLVKEVIKAGIVVYESSSQWLAEASERWSDLMAEVRSELSERSGPNSPTSGPSSPDKGDDPTS
jgi:hypothetical protein